MAYVHAADFVFQRLFTRSWTGRKPHARTRRALAPSCHRARDLAFSVLLVPGTGFEPVFLGSEASVLPARRSRSAPAYGPVFRAHVGVAASNDAAVGPEGVEPSPTRVRAGCASNYATDLRDDEESVTRMSRVLQMAHERGTQTSAPTDARASCESSVR